MNEERKRLFDSNKLLAYSIANSLYVDKSTAMEREDYEQMALLYLWEACLKYDNNSGNQFSTFAQTYIKNAFTDYIRKTKAQKRDAKCESLDEPYWSEDEENTAYDYIAEKEDTLSYQMLRWDIEMQLTREKRRIKAGKKKEKSLLTGIAIIGNLLEGKSGSEIIYEYGLTTPTYHRCLKKARMCLFQKG